MDHDDSAAATGTAISKTVDEQVEVRSEKEQRLPTATLSDQEKEIIDRQLTAPNLSIGYFSLFRYAALKDKIIMIAALIASIAAGAVMPLMTVRYISKHYIPLYRFRTSKSFSTLAKRLRLDARILRKQESMELTGYSLFMVISLEALPAFQLMQLLRPNFNIRLRHSHSTLYTWESGRLSPPMSVSSASRIPENGLRERFGSSTSAPSSGKTLLSSTSSDLVRSPPASVPI